MKKTPLQRKTPLQAKQPWRPKRTPLRQKGQSEAARIKDSIQALLRAIVIIRDGGCILRHVQGYGIPYCNGYTKDGQLILQFDHLVTRSNSESYADGRLGVCICQGHHGWKSVGNNQRKQEYDALVRSLLPKDRVELWDRCEAERPRSYTRKGAYDWKLEEAALRVELAKLQKEQGMRSDGTPLFDNKQT
jgi:hypothetical protein